MDLFIQCENLVKIYKVADLEVVALQGLDLTVTKGELLGVVGASGSGKSTLLNILGGLDRPSAGHVSVGGRDLLKATDGELDAYRRTEVGFVWQQTARNLIPYLSAQENVVLPMILAGISRRERRTWAEELLHAVGLWEHRQHKLGQLSGGQQQRVAIAVALANKPTLLLGDEPTGELDTATADDILSLLNDMNRQYELTMIIVTHDPTVARAVDRVVMIRDGRTSSETVHRAAGMEDAVAQTMSPHYFGEYVVVDGAGRLQIPPELREEAGIGRRVTLEITEAGILIKPALSENGLSGEMIVSIDEAQSAGRRGNSTGHWLRRRIRRI